MAGIDRRFLIGGGAVAVGSLAVVPRWQRLFAEAGPVAEPEERGNGPTQNMDIDYLYSPESISSIEGRIVTNVWETGASVDYGTFDYNKTMLRIYDMRRVAEEPIDWPVGDFTGLFVPTPRHRFQKGVNPGHYGSTAFQVWDTAMGFQIASNFLAWDPAKPRKEGEYAGAHFVYRWENDDIRPWARRGRSARLRLQYDVAIHHYDRVGDACRAYWAGAIWLKDVSSRHHIVWVFWVWKDTDMPKEDITDDHGTPAVLVSTIYAPNTIFSTTEITSSHTSFGPRFSSQTFWYAAYIEGDHLIRAVQKHNHREIDRVLDGTVSLDKMRILSPDPRNYAVKLIDIGPEMIIRDRPPSDTSFCHFGSHVKNVNLITMYNGA
jgi:hypothetical protein